MRSRLDAVHNSAQVVVLLALLAGDTFTTIHAIHTCCAGLQYQQLTRLCNRELTSSTLSRCSLRCICPDIAVLL